MQGDPNAVWSIPYVSLAFFPSLKRTFISYHVQIAFLKIPSCDNQSLVGCILIPIVAVNWNLKS